MIVGYALSIAGVEYLFATSGVATLPTSSDANWSTAWTVLDGALDWSSGVSWTVRGRSDGSLDSGSLTFHLHDLVASTGTASGKNVCTWMFTRRPELLPSTHLAVSVPSSVVATLTVDSVAALAIAGYPTTVYVDREAIRVSGSPSGTTLTVAGSGQGYWGSLLAAHSVDGANLRYPVVWATLPTIVRRKVILWAVDDANAATPIWRGTVGVGPELAEDGARFALQCEGIWTGVAAQRLGDPYALCRFSGYWGSAVGALVTRDGSFIGGSTGGARHWRSLDGVLNRIRVATRSAATGGLPTDAGLHLSQVGRALSALANSTSGSNLQVEVFAGSQRALGQSTQTAGTRSARATIADVPPAILRAQAGRYNNFFPVDDASQLPTSWAVQTFTDNGYTTTSKYSLRAEYSADEYLLFDVQSHSATTTASDGTEAPWVQGSMSFEPRNNHVPLRTSSGDLVAEGALVAKVVPVVTGQHVACVLRRVFDSGTTAVSTTIDAADWEWASDGTPSPALAKLVASNATPYAERTYELDGSLTVADVLKEQVVINGWSLGLRGSRIAVVPIGPATPGTTVAATIAETDLCAAPTWQMLAEEQITAVDVDSDAIKLQVTNVSTRGTYGEGRTVKVKLTGQRAQAAAATNLLDFARYVLSRVQGPYSEPIAALTITLAAARWLTTIRWGDYVDVSEWLAPDGAGGRGVGNATALAAFAAATQRAQVVGWDPDLRTGEDGGGTLKLTLLLFAQVAGYAPACKVATSPSTTTITVATDFINGVGEYTSPDVGEADGGAAQFRAGDVVQFRLMDSTTETVYGPYTILSVSTVTITFTGAIDAALRTAIAAGDWYDLVYYYATGIIGGADATRQLGFAFVGSYTAGIIGGDASLPNRPWAP